MGAGRFFRGLGKKIGLVESDEEKALRDQKKIVEELAIMPAAKRNIVIEQLKSVGQLTPEMEEDILQANTEMQGIRLDPAYKQAQMAALNKLSQMGTEGGLTLEDKVAQADALRDVGISNRGRQEAVLQNMAQRGQLGSGAELAARLSATDAAAERSNQVGMATAANAQKRALEALMQSGQLAGSLRGQEYDEQADAARAQDYINQFNTSGRRGTQERNVDSRNRAQAGNLSEAQRIADANAGLTTSQRQQNKQNEINYQNDINNRAREAAGLGVQYGAAKDQGEMSGVTALGNLVEKGIDVAANYATGGLYGAAKGVAGKMSPKKKPEDDDSNEGSYY